MKRATLQHVKLRTHATYTSERNLYIDILDSDARQRAEIRALRKALREVEGECDETLPADRHALNQITTIIALAIATKRRAR